MFCTLGRDRESSESCFSFPFGRRSNELIRDLLPFDRHGMEYVRTVTEPIKQVSIVEGMKGWWDDYHHIDKEVSPVFF